MVNSSDLNLLANLQKPDQLGRWSTPGVNIDIDNLMTSPPKVTTSSSGPSMNQLAQSGFGTSQTQFAGPNYNIDTSALMGQRLPPGGMRPGGFGTGPAVGTGMGYAAPGMGYGGVRPMYYTAAAGGYGAQPMVPGGYGASGYGGMAGPYSNVNPMGMQQRPM